MNVGFSFKVNLHFEPQEHWVQSNIGKKKIWVRKTIGQKYSSQQIYVSKERLGPTNIESKVTLDRKKILVRKTIGLKYSSQQIYVSKEMLGPRNWCVHKIYVEKMCTRLTGCPPKLFPLLFLDILDFLGV